MEVYASLKPCDESITKIYKLLSNNKIPARGVKQSHCTIFRYKGKECDFIGLTPEEKQDLNTFGINRTQTIELGENSLIVNPSLDFEVLGKKRLALILKRSSIRGALDSHYEYLRFFLEKYLSVDDCDCIYNAIKSSSMMVNPHLSISNNFPIGRPIKSLKRLEHTLVFDKLYLEVKYQKIREEAKMAS